MNKQILILSDVTFRLPILSRGIVRRNRLSGTYTGGCFA